MAAPPYFQNTHPINHHLDVERKNLSPSLKVIETLLRTPWNGAAALFRIFLDFRQAISILFFNEMTCANE